MRSWKSLTVLALALAGCTSDPGSALVEPGAPVPPLRADLAYGQPLDVRFAPLEWSPGDRLVVEALSEAGRVRLRSTAGRTGHTVDVLAPGRRVLRVVGLLDGTAQATAPADGDAADGGTTSEGPTSVHRDVVCQGSVCVEVIEYDYDQTSLDGDGTTRWTPGSVPSPSESFTIDRIRFELADGRPGTADVHLTAPEELALGR